MTAGWSSPETPEEWDMKWRTRTSCLPLAPNSGQYRATGASSSSWPRSTSISAARLVPVLVAKPTPDVDHDVAVDVQDERCAQLLTRVEVPRQRRAHSLEPPVPPAVDVRHDRVLTCQPVAAVSS